MMEQEKQRIRSHRTGRIPVSQPLAEIFLTFLPRMKFSGPLVNIYVGSKKQKWVVHQDILCKRPSLFRKVLERGENGFKVKIHLFCTRLAVFRQVSEGNKQGCEIEIYLVEEDPKVFGHFVDWIYGQHLFGEEYYENAEKVTVDHAKEWLALHIFAYNTCLKMLADEALAKYLACTKARLPDHEEIQLIYDRSLQISPLRKHAVDALVVEFFGQSSDDLDSFATTMACHIDFTRDLAKGIKEHGRLYVKECEISRCSVHKKSTRAVRDRGNLQASPAIPANLAGSAIPPDPASPVTSATHASSATSSSPLVMNPSRQEAKKLQGSAKMEHANMFSSTGPREFKLSAPETIGYGGYFPPLSRTERI